MLLLSPERTTVFKFRNAFLFLALALFAVMASSPVKAQYALSVNLVSSPTFYFEDTDHFNGYMYTFTHTDVVQIDVILENAINAYYFAEEMSVPPTIGYTITQVLDHIEHSDDGGDTWDVNYGFYDGVISTHGDTSIARYSSSLTWNTTNSSFDEDPEWDSTIDPLTKWLYDLGQGGYTTSQTFRFKYHYHIVVSYYDGYGPHTDTADTVSGYRNNDDSESGFDFIGDAGTEGGG